MIRLSSIVLTLIVVGLCSCNRSAQPSRGSGANESLSINGLTITYPSSLDRDDLSIRNNNVIIDFKEHKLEVVDGRLKFDGDSFGAVKKGDQIVVQSDGTIQINSNTVAPNSVQGSTPE